MLNSSMISSSVLSSSMRILQGTLDLGGKGSERLVRKVFEAAGIEVGGSQPHDIRINNPKFYTRLLRDGSLGFGESYMDGWWDSDAIDQTITKFGLADLNTVMRDNWYMIPYLIKARVLNLQRGLRAFEVGEKHYDIGNDLYEAMLDRHMAYTCGYWRDSDNLDDAQEAKLELVCRKIGLREGMTVLELGCGWGSFAKYAAEKYGARITGLTVSKEQVKLGHKRCQGLPVDIQLKDYRDAVGTYDAVISIGIMEHVGPKNYRNYMKVVERCLRPDGVAFVHTIAGNRSRTSTEPWTGKYIFPNSVLPTMTQLGAALEGIFVLEDVHNFGPDYDRTLMAWQDNFLAAWPVLKNQYDERFYRMWRYYLCMCAAAFRSRQLQLYQLVLTRTGTGQRDFRQS